MISRYMNNIMYGPNTRDDSDKQQVGRGDQVLKKLKLEDIRSRNTRKLDRKYDNHL